MCTDSYFARCFLPRSFCCSRPENGAIIFWIRRSLISSAINDKILGLFFFCVLSCASDFSNVPAVCDHGTYGGLGVDSALRGGGAFRSCGEPREGQRLKVHCTISYLMSVSPLLKYTSLSLRSDR